MYLGLYQNKCMSLIFLFVHLRELYFCNNCFLYINRFINNFYLNFVSTNAKNIYPNFLSHILITIFLTKMIIVCGKLFLNKNK